jgi:hypothetical protein
MAGSRFLLFLSGWMLICNSIMAGTNQWIESRPGTILRYTGEIRISDKKNPIWKTVEVVDEYYDAESKETWIVHKIVKEISGTRESQLRYYAIRENGIFQVAQKDTETSSLQILTPSSLILPLPVGMIRSWSVTTKQPPKQQMQYNLKDLQTEIRIKDSTYRCLYIEGEGTVTTLGMTHSVQKKIWCTPELGIVREIHLQKVGQSSTETVLELTEISKKGSIEP